MSNFESSIDGIFWELQARDLKDTKGNLATRVAADAETLECLKRIFELRHSDCGVMLHLPLTLAASEKLSPAEAAMHVAVELWRRGFSVSWNQKDSLMTVMW